MSKENLLIELGTEELPPKALKKLAQAFAQSFEKDLNVAEIEYNEIKWYASPRRLALKVMDVATRQKDKTIEKKGPAVSAAFKDGVATPAALGWAKSNGIAIEEAERLKTEKGEWLLYRAEVPGKNIKELIPVFLENAVKSLPIPKMMHWGSTKFEFVRPVHTLCVMLGTDLVDMEMFGIKSDRLIRGHRFMGEPLVSISSVNDYPDKLEKEGMVVADYAKRREIIKTKIEQEAEKIGGVADLDESLLDEVTSLVEWPSVMTAKFEERFLQVPSEALVYTMKGDQKYFPVYDKDGNLMSNFIFISNIVSKDPEQVILGNERVVRPRLSDAEFFFNTDKKHSLESLLPRLETVLFQKQLGTLREKSERVEKLSRYIAAKLNADVEKAGRAGLLSKCDLLTNMVMEFTDTQGIMGMHYARHDGEDEVVAKALFEQYLPRFAGDKLPSNLVSSSVSLADKIDTMVGIFGVNLPPKGDKDPFGLRRAAIGILRITSENKYDINLEDLVNQSISLYGDKLSNKNVHNDVLEYIIGRLKYIYQEAGIKTEVINAVLALKLYNPADIDRRIVSVNKFISTPAAPSLCAANKRVSNILSKNKELCSGEFNSELLQVDAEKKLATAILAVKAEAEPLLVAGNYDSALTLLSTLKDDVDEFFDKVMVLDNDPKIRDNRLSLVSNLRNLFLRIADISLL